MLKVIIWFVFLWLVSSFVNYIVFHNFILFCFSLTRFDYRWYFYAQTFDFLVGWWSEFVYGLLQKLVVISVLLYEWHFIIECSFHVVTCFFKFELYWFVLSQGCGWSCLYCPGFDVGAVSWGSFWLHNNHASNVVCIIFWHSFLPIDQILGKSSPISKLTVDIFLNLCLPFFNVLPREVLHPFEILVLAFHLKCSSRWFTWRSHIYFIHFLSHNLIFGILIKKIF